ncbi:hypothetical protein INR49_003279 [Caranx melampygus]|nr:hypothetical protein INR49_003279 [Caranx melampygus]
MMPELPVTMRRIDLRNNKLVSRGLHAESFKNNNIQSLHEDTFCDSHNRNFIRRNLEDIRLDGNP